MAIGTDHEAGAEIGEINVIPFIDVCLVLLIILLMISASTSSMKEVTMPSLSSTDFRDMNLATTLTVAPAADAAGKAVLNDDGKRVYQYFFEEGADPIDAKNLWTFLKTVQRDDTWSMLVIRADNETPYEYISRAVQCAQALGVEEIDFGVKNKEAEAAALPH